eukprot:CAMPEP_0194391946 /NCGR_PEP_ID=MMETSP0174-20130528/118760_1 /TAXON_ID=216777 /ORGANISM="Proboscia alata, Strain PI-D3" /LENGTH=428 /DNA_ID=CAMNT_0039186819 /DNA_START=289 /DNA_END=1575 /DNA_ORIENTATION=+
MSQGSFFPFQPTIAKSWDGERKKQAQYFDDGTWEHSSEYSSSSKTWSTTTNHADVLNTSSDETAICVENFKAAQKKEDIIDIAEWHRLEYEALKKDDANRTEQELKKRTRMYKAEYTRMQLLEGFGFQNDEKKRKCDERTIIRGIEMRAKQLRIQLELEKERELKAEMARLRESENITKKIVTMMRSYGIVDGKVKERKDITPIHQHLSSQTVRLSLADQKNSFTDNKGVFNVELRLYQNAEVIICSQIGTRGATALAGHILSGSCPSLHSLFLGWNGVGQRGLVELIKALLLRFEIENHDVTALKCLDLSANNINSPGLLVLEDAFKKSAAFRMITELNISSNFIGDKGAMAIVNMMLVGYLAKIIKLHLNRCQICNDGMKALISIACSEALTKCTPHVMIISLRGNHPTIVLMKRYQSLFPECLMI